MWSVHGKGRQKFVLHAPGHMTKIATTPMYGHYNDMPMPTANFYGCKNNNFQMNKKDDIFLIFAQNIDCGYMSKNRGDSNEYPQYMFKSKNKKK